MFVNVSELVSQYHCKIIGYGHTDVGDDPRIRLVGQEEFIRAFMTDAGRTDLFGHKGPWSTDEIQATVAKWHSMPGISTRLFFSGTVMELAVSAARKALAHASLGPQDLDLIIDGTNTGPGYPSLADHIKRGLGGDSQAMCWHTTEACTVGVYSVFQAWSLIRSGACRHVLVVCAEKATTLAPVDDWKNSNLFGDAASAFVLSRTNGDDAFLFFDGQSRPEGENINHIKKTESGFQQDGNKVHAFVGSTVVQDLTKAIRRAEINPADIKHLVPHQPSRKTLDFLYKGFRAGLPDSQPIFHRCVETTGNLSGASTGFLISRGVYDGTIKPGDLVVVNAFGGGLSIGSYAFRA